MRKKRRILHRLILLLLLMAGFGLAAVYLVPLLSPVEIVTYADYTVQRGSIVTDKSFSASIDVLHSETHQNTSRAESIREIYVTRGQEVKKGDKLMLLDNGEVLKAGLDGVVTEMNYDTTDMLRNNAQLIQISDLQNLQVSLSIDEYDVRNIVAGQKCIVTIVPLGVDFEAEITHVDRVSSSTGQVAYYTATAKLTVPSNVLPGMTASVTMPNKTAENVLLLDMAALAFDEQKQPYVLFKEGDTYAKSPVTCGLSDGTKVEIVSGLREGDRVWAVSGTETVKTSFSLGEIYKKLVGEKIVINQVDTRNGRSPSFGNGAEGFFPGGFSREDGAGTMPEGFPIVMPEESPASDSAGEEAAKEEGEFPALEDFRFVPPQGWNDIDQSDAPMGAGAPNQPNLERMVP